MLDLMLGYFDFLSIVENKMNFVGIARGNVLTLLDLGTED